jgi:DNA-binding transcriptional LysR family regulator
MTQAPPANLRSLDLNLLTVFAAIYETGSITRAADRIALSQSATSHALARLRDACKDDLFVRVGQGIAPTPVAQRIYPAIRRALDGLAQSIAEARGFDPATSTRHFQIGIPHPMGPIWAIALRDAAHTLAPGIVLHFDTRTLPVDQYGNMRAGTLDLAVDWIAAEDDRFVHRNLFEDAIVFIARRGHPRARARMSLKTFRREAFVRVHERAGVHAETVRSLRQSLLSLDLDWVLNVSEFLEVPFLVMQTDLLGFVARSMISPASDAAGLVVIDPGLPPMPVPINLVWHETRRADAGHRWLRDFVASQIVALAKAGQG